MAHNIDNIYYIKKKCPLKKTLQTHLRIVPAEYFLVGDVGVDRRRGSVWCLDSADDVIHDLSNNLLSLLLLEISL